MLTGTSKGHMMNLTMVFMTLQQEKSSVVDLRFMIVPTKAGNQVRLNVSDAQTGWE